VSALLISLQTFSCSSSHSKGSLLCGFIEGFGQEGVVRDLDSAETCSSPKLSDLLVSLGS
jgi:hypothetical protein